MLELQKIDCNCNDCKFMTRDLLKRKESLELHHKWQLDYFELMKQKRIEKAIDWKGKGEVKKHDTIMKEVLKMKFQFDKSVVSINYGNCSKFEKPVSFIPSVCQLETQKCFQHRLEK